MHRQYPRKEEQNEAETCQKTPHYQTTPFVNEVGFYPARGALSCGQWSSVREKIAYLGYSERYRRSNLDAVADSGHFYHVLLDSLRVTGVLTHGTHRGTMDCLYFNPC
jgi:hypothetical protein